MGLRAETFSSGTKTLPATMKTLPATIVCTHRTARRDNGRKLQFWRRDNAW